MQKLKLNEEKTEFLVAGSQKHLRTLNNVSRTLGNSQIIPSPAIKISGVYFDSNMSMSDQINDVCKSVRFQLRSVSKIRRYN